MHRAREGSTGPSRGEHRLTVYRAHASLVFQVNKLFGVTRPFNRENLAAHTTEFNKNDPGPKKRL